MPRRTSQAPVGIGGRVQEARKGAGLTQIELAKKALVNQSTISELENSGQKGAPGYNLGADVACRIAETCGVRIKWLVTGQGSKYFEPADVAGSSMLDDWAVLSEEARAELLRRLRELADTARRLGKPVSDEKVAKHLPSAPDRKKVQG